MANSSQTSTITLEGAQIAAEAALAKAASVGVNACVAVVDQSGALKSFSRMDGAVAMAAEVAKDKAYTVAATGMPTHVIWAFMEAAPASMSAALLKTDGIQILGGGVPLVVEGVVVGAIGVSGGVAQQDQEIAEAGAAALA